MNICWFETIAVCQLTVNGNEYVMLIVFHGRAALSDFYSVVSLDSRSSTAWKRPAIVLRLTLFNQYWSPDIVPSTFLHTCALHISVQACMCTMEPYQTPKGLAPNQTTPDKVYLAVNHLIYRDWFQPRIFKGGRGIFLIPQGSLISSCPFSSHSHMHQNVVFSI